jgi:hypothetical protein
MVRASGILCACLVILLAGCALNVGNTRVDVAVKVDEQAVDATLEDAALKLKAELERRGLQVSVSPEVDAVRVVSSTKAGDKFTVVLTRSQTEAGREQTRVRVEWDKAPDRELWLGLVVAIGATALQSPR